MILAIIPVCIFCYKHFKYTGCVKLLSLIIGMSDIYWYHGLVRIEL